MYNRILLATDNSENSICAHREAMKLAKNSSATLYVLEVVNLTEELDSLSPGLSSELEEKARKAVEEIAGQARDLGIKAEALTKKGEPHRKILETVREIEADAIVLATHGKKGFFAKLMGSVTRSVIAEAFVPVIIVHSRFCSIK